MWTCRRCLRRHGVSARCRFKAGQLCWVWPVLPFLQVCLRQRSSIILCRFPPALAWISSSPASSMVTLYFGIETVKHLLLMLGGHLTIAACVLRRWPVTCCAGSFGSCTWARGCRGSCKEAAGKSPRLPRASTSSVRTPSPSVPKGCYVVPRSWAGISLPWITRDHFKKWKPITEQKSSHKHKGRNTKAETARSHRCGTNRLWSTTDDITGWFP